MRGPRPGEGLSVREPGRLRRVACGDDVVLVAVEAGQRGRVLDRGRALRDDLAPASSTENFEDGA
jgi:hypothetical protein